jgi:sporulation protein YlmC with PRC-barrel domain
MRKFLLAAVAAGALAGASAMAQNTTPNNGTTAAADTDKTVSQDAPTNGSNFIQVRNTDMLSSNVVGLDIYNGQSNNIGKIQDIAFDTSRRVTGYILSVGGFLGMGSHYVAVDPNAVMVQYDTDKKTWRATMNATKDQLKSAPEFKYSGQWTASRS